MLDLAAFDHLLDLVNLVTLYRRGLRADVSLP